MAFNLQKKLTNNKFRNKMWEWSGKDCTIKYHFDDDGTVIDEGTLPKKLGKRAVTTNISRSEHKFAQSLFDQVEKITGLTFEKEKKFDRSDIALMCVLDSTRSSHSQMDKDWEQFDSYWDDDGTNSLTESDKIGLAQAIYMTLGLNLINKSGIDTLDTVMSTRGDTYHGLSVDDIAVLQDNWNFTACL